MVKDSVETWKDTLGRIDNKLVKLFVNNKDSVFRIDADINSSVNGDVEVNFKSNYSLDLQDLELIKEAFKPDVMTITGNDDADVGVLLILRWKPKE